MNNEKSYSLIVIHQKWASAEGAGALFVLGGPPSPPLSVSSLG